jgi:Protein of unknown function (DUF1553)/Protein of unknown function (DUF1549)/Planctomycete cytochrome C
MRWNCDSPARRLVWLLWVGLAVPRSALGDGEPATDLALAKADPAAVEFFEKSVRPILAERCLGCHGPSKQRGKLRLDSRAAVLAGGATGPAITPGQPEMSLLIDAINYGELFQMPPRSRLPAGEIATLTRWIKEGAAWGVLSRRADGKAVSAERETAQIRGLETPGEFQRRSRHWSFQPIRRTDPPAVKEGHASWPRNPIDGFLLAAMERQGLSPAPEADRRTLIRRLTFDLIGLPPTAKEVSAFLADDSPDAYERLVDRLLASPHHGERWARHWLDLVRFAETAGHEFDYDIPNAFRYRDYVIRTLNVDLPYDRFVIEQVAGDLLPVPRRYPGLGTNESVVGTGFFFLGEGTHSPVDVTEEQTRRIDNQIDVFGKTFLGLTIACARCHDHKFDPIRSKDYYALAGFLRSSRHQQAFIDSPDRNSAQVCRLKELKRTIRELLLEAQPLLPEAIGKSVQKALTPRPIAAAPGSTATFERFNKNDFGGWSVTGDAFGDRPTRPADFRLILGPSVAWLIPVLPGQAHSGLISSRLQGVLRSESFTISSRFIHTLVSGQGARINVVVDGFEKIRDPIYGALTVEVNVGDQPRWITQDVGMWMGHRAYLEFADGAAAVYSGAQTHMQNGNGYLAIDEVRFSNQPTRDAVPTAPAPIRLEELLTLIRSTDSSLAGRLAAALASYRTIEASIQEPSFSLAMTTGTGEDQRILIRGNPHSPGELVPRRFLEILGGADQRSHAQPDRLDLAFEMVDPRSNPLLPRVLVNRLWKHHFGEGLVKTADDFGAMGQTPSHPDLLDWLADEFVARGWSIKAMHRLMVTSRAYRMSSALRDQEDRRDPSNTYLHRMNLRRLDAEVMRDALLAVAGRLDPAMFGPGVPPYLSPYLEGRGRPGHSGPLDGDGRRSIYLNVRRNFLNPLFQAFDAPVPFSTMGRRNVSNVPAQALALLNDPLVMHLARLWAEQLVSSPHQSDRQRIACLFEAAFARPPSNDEVRRCLAFLQGQSGTGADHHDAASWADLCHVIINVKEFIYID